MITSIELTDAGVERFNRWFRGVAKDGVRIDAVMLEMLDKLADGLGIGDAPIYELGPRYTNTGMPELLCLDTADFVVIEQPDD